MAKFTSTINKLIKGLLHVHNKVFLIDTNQFYSAEQNRNITMFVLSERIWDEGRGRFTKQQIMKTASQIDIVKYLAERMKRLNDGLD